MLGSIWWLPYNGYRIISIEPKIGKYTFDLQLFHFFRVLEGGLCAATVLVSFGVLIGKINPLQVISIFWILRESVFLDILKTKLFQLLLLGLIETVLFVGNCHVGYSLFGAVDVGMVGTKTFSFLLHQLSQRRIHLCTRLWGLLWHGNHRRDEQVSLLSLFLEPSMAAAIRLFFNLMIRKNFAKAGDEKNDTTPTSDIFSLLGW